MGYNKTLGLRTTDNLLALKMNYCPKLKTVALKYDKQLLPFCLGVQSQNQLRLYKIHVLSTFKFYTNELIKYTIQFTQLNHQI